MIEKFGVPPDKVIEVQALIGDSTDNVPGVPGIGVKTAAQLIGEYGDLETLLKRAGEIKQDKRRQTLIDNAESARISKRLVTLDQNVKLEVPVEDLAVHEPDYKLLIAFLKAMEFSTLTRRVAEKSGIEANEIEANAKLTSGAKSAAKPAAPSARCGQGQRARRQSASCSRRRSQARGARATNATAISRLRRSPPRISPPPRPTRSTAANTRPCARLDRLKAWVLRAKDLGVVAVDTETTGLDPMVAHLCGFSLAVADNEACYVPIGHREGGAQGGSDLFAPEPKLCAGPDSGEGRAEGDQGGAGRPRHPQGRPEPEIRLADLRAAAASRFIPTTTPC